MNKEVEKFFKDSNNKLKLLNQQKYKMKSTDSYNKEIYIYDKLSLVKI